MIVTVLVLIAFGTSIAIALMLFGFLAACRVLLVILGTVLDAASILLVLRPLGLSVVSAAGRDLIW